ncbi:MAG: glycerol-3-phosphate 1-O-acyltransferase PlsY [Hyphomicrobiales bacterium]
MDWLVTIVSLIVAYLLGSIPTSVWVGKFFYNIDVRTKGSGNAGATNTIRVLGYKAGVPVLIFDILKGILAILIVSYVLPDHLLDYHNYFKIAAGLLAVIGHIFPVFARFNGGKGVATIAGVAIALYPFALLVILGIFILMMVLFNYVSLASITSAIAFPFVVYFGFHETNYGLIGLAILVAIFIPLTHKKNIQRLLKGEESKFFKKRKP